MRTGDIIFVSTDSLLGKLIKWRTASKWTHCAILIGENHFVEATFPKVRAGRLDTSGWRDFKILTPRVPLTEEEKKKLVIFLTKKVGTFYDVRGLLSFVVGKNIGNKSFYFCSELVAESYAKIGRPLLRRCPGLVSPQDLYQSLELREV